MREKREVFNSFEQKIMIHKNAFNLSRSFGGFFFEGDRGRNGMEKIEHTMCVMAQLKR